MLALPVSMNRRLSYGPDGAALLLRVFVSEFRRDRRILPHEAPAALCHRRSERDAGRRTRRGQDIIDLGMGNPDLPPPPHVIEKLCEVAMKPDAHGYSASKGIPGVRKAQASYYARRFNVELDPETEVVMTMGSKEGLASLATAITAPGDVVLAPNPSYPIHRSVSSLPGPRSVRCRPHRMNATGNRLTGQCATACRAPRS